LILFLSFAGLFGIKKAGLSGIGLSRRKCVEHRAGSREHG
jgi:hypothetical protein